jgi:hypothetical protein
MNEGDKPASEQRNTDHDESQSLSDTARITESAEARERARHAIIKLRMRRRRRTVIIK